MKIKINEEEITLKNSFRSLIIFEQITKKPFNPQTTTDVIIYFYSVVCASVKGYTIDWDDFMDWLDENPDAINDFNDFLLKNAKFNEKLSPKETKKKVTK